LHDGAVNLFHAWGDIAVGKKLYVIDGSAMAFRAYFALI